MSEIEEQPLKLNKEQRVRLREGLLSAFNSGSFTIMVRDGLDVRLQDVVPNGPFVEVVSNLIGWAEEQGKLIPLIRAARQAIPNNPKLRLIAEELLHGVGPQPSRAPSHFDGPQRERLRQALMTSYPQRAELAMLVDSCLNVNLDQIAAVNLNLEQTAFELIRWANADPQGRMNSLLEGAVKGRPNSLELSELHREFLGR